MSEGDGLWDPPYDPEFENSVLRALGWMVVQSEMLEHALSDLYRVSTGKDHQEVHEAVRGKTLGAVAGLAVPAFENRFPNGDVRQRFDALRSELERAIETRNQFVHASWSFDHAKRVMHRRRLPRGTPGVREFLQFSPADVDAGAEFVGSTAVKLWDEVYFPAKRALHPPKTK